MTHPELPASIEAEKAVLGAILLNREAIAAVEGALRPEHFYLERHGAIYSAALACQRAGIPPDVRTISEELRRRGQLDDVGGFPYLGELIDYTPVSSHIAYYATTVITSATRRRLIAVGGQIAAMGYNESEDLALILAHAHELLDASHTPIADPRYVPFTADDLDDETIPPMRWAIPNLLPQGLTLLIGKPKMRKSWFALSTALAVAIGGRALGAIPVEKGDVLYLALEDSKRRLQSRQRKILSGTAAPSNLYYMTSAPRLDAGLLGTVDGWLKKHESARLVIIDVLAMVRPAVTGRGNMYDEDYSHVKPLQELAHRRDVAILLIHHMNRSDAADAYDLVNGSSGVGGAVDGLLALQYERGQTDATLIVSSRDLEDDDTLALRWDNATAQWILLGKAEEVKASNERQAILKLFREEKRAMGPKEAAELLDKHGEYHSVKQLMYRMAKDGDLQVTGRGMYALPSLTLIPRAESNAGDRGDPDADHLFHGTGTPENGQSNAGDPILHSKNLDHLDHLVTLEGFEASESEEKSNAAPDHLRYFGEVDWPYVRALFAAGNLKAIRTHCVMRRKDYDQVLRSLSTEDQP